MIHNFHDGHGFVPADRHLNPDGSTGGWVANTASVAPTVTLGLHARVSGRARIGGNVVIRGRAWISGSAMVFDRASVSGHARVSGCAQVFGGAHVSGHAKVLDRAQVFGGARVSGHTLICGDSRVSGGAQIHDGADILFGGRWTAYRTAEGVALQYGDLTRPLAWWEEQDIPALLKRMELGPEHEKWIGWVLTGARMLQGERSKS